MYIWIFPHIGEEKNALFGHFVLKIADYSFIDKNKAVPFSARNVQGNNASSHTFHVKLKMFFFFHPYFMFLEPEMKLGIARRFLTYQENDAM